MKTHLNEKFQIDCFPAEIFDNNHDRHICERKLFLSYFKEVPNAILEKNIDVLKFTSWFKSKYRDQIWDMIFTKRDHTDEDNLPKYDDCYFFLDKDLLVFTDTHKKLVKLLFRRTDNNIIDSLYSEVRKFKLKIIKSTSKMDIIYSGRLGLSTDTFELKTLSCQLRLNYNDDLLEYHEIILKRLNTPNDKGIILLHGEPGTGKTTYIRHLIGQTTKKILFVPPHIAASITGPELLGLLLDYSNSILVIEDAENLVMDRNNSGNSPVSALLNISDGLLSDCLHIQIICSFNTPLSKVDKALLRKGRLIAKYEFLPLETTKANELSRSLGFETIFSEPQVLTDIYNQEEKTVSFQNNIAVGFK